MAVSHSNNNAVSPMKPALNKIMTKEIVPNIDPVFKSNNSGLKTLKTIGGIYEGGGVSFNLMAKPLQNENQLLNSKQNNSNIVKKVFVKQKSTVNHNILTQLNSEVELIKITEKCDLFKKDTDTAECNSNTNVIPTEKSHEFHESLTSQDLILISNQEDNNHKEYFKNDSIIKNHKRDPTHSKSLSNDSNSDKSDDESASKVGQLPHPAPNNHILKKSFVKRGSIFKNHIRDCIDTVNKMKNLALYDKLKTIDKPNLKQSILRSSFLNQGQIEKVDNANQEKKQFLIDEYTREIKQLQNEVAVYRTYFESVSSKLESEKRIHSKLESEIQNFEARSSKIHQSEIDNLTSTFKSYKDFYEQELESRKQIIEGLLIKVDETKGK